MPSKPSVTLVVPTLACSFIVAWAQLRLLLLVLQLPLVLVVLKFMSNEQEAFFSLLGAKTNISRATYSSSTE